MDATGRPRLWSGVAIVAAMATQSLYRRYRPRRFSEVKGQDHVVRALRTSVAEGREGQAYLFSGPRGTGKTTSARILAKVLNCENPTDGEPCCECDSCLAVERGVSYDVHELDAASNNGVEAMRDLIEKASLGTPGRHKVYILDEVHMLSRAAEAALLKTLEEPPPHVVFVLATTDPQKMSDTIRSRTQHLQFHLLPADTLAEHVRWVAADAGLDVSEAAFEQALSRGGGSARDTLSALELVSNTGDEGMEVVPLDEFVDAMIDRDSGRGLTVVAHAISSGMDPRTLTEELISFLRNGFLALMAPELVQVPSNRLDVLAAQAQRLGAAGLVRGIELLGGVAGRDAPRARPACAARRGHRATHLRQRRGRHRRRCCSASNGSSARWPPVSLRRSTRRHRCRSTRPPGAPPSAVEPRSAAAPTPAVEGDRRPETGHCTARPPTRHRLVPRLLRIGSPGGDRCHRLAGSADAGRIDAEPVDHRRGVGEHDPPGAARDGARRVRAGWIRRQHRLDADAVRAERRSPCQVRRATFGRRVGARGLRRRPGRGRTARRWQRWWRQRCSRWRARCRIRPGSRSRVAQETSASTAAARPGCGQCRGRAASGRQWGQPGRVVLATPTRARGGCCGFGDRRGRPT